jgi:tight adherence protein C
MEGVVFSYLLTMMLLVMGFLVYNLEKDTKLKKRIDSHVHLRDPVDSSEASNKRKSLKNAVKAWFVNKKQKLRKYYKNTLPTKHEDEIQKVLLRAGSPFKMTVADYFVINNIIKIAVPLLLGALALILHANFVQVTICILIGFIISFKAMDIYLNLKAKERYSKALKELPDFLDLLTISVEAGLGFDLALNKTIEKRDGVLPLEFHTCLEEMRLGRSRKEALLGIKDRLAFDEMISFVNSIIQSEKLGTGIAQTLRAKSEEERDKRKQRAEEAAMKTTIKILFPLIFFIFPSIFIIVFGPAAIQLVDSLKGLL